ncbi:Bestrophin [Cooperia oncophora]
MTVNYHRAASTSRPWTFFKLLFKWKGSIWKAVYMELICFLIIYGIISVIYRCALSKSQQLNFERVVRYFDARLDYIPLELVLGFFCTQVFNRWNKQYDTIGFIDKSEQARMYRRNILRYCELVQVLVFRDVSMRVRRRFPTLDTIVAAGFMLPHEKEIFKSYNGSSPKYWIPANWALAMTYQAWKHGYIESAYYKVTLQEVVCLAVHFYFLVCIFARQQIVVEHEFKTEVDTYFPIMTALQFVFYMGWMKVIEAVINPLEKMMTIFETNALIDRNITMGMMIVDQGYDRPPELRRDPFWDSVHPLYSEETSRIPNNVPQGSVSHVKLASSVSEVVMMPHSRAETGNTPVFSTGASIRKSKNVKVKDDERYKPRQREESMIFRRVKFALNKYEFFFYI